MDKFTSKHIAFVLLGTSIVSMKTYPTILTRSGGRDTWIAVIISSVLIFLYIVYSMRIFQKCNCFNLYKIYCMSFGKIIGNILYCFFMLTLFFTLIEGASVEASSMHTNMLIETPSWFFMLLFVLPAIYTVNQDIVAIISVTMIGITLITLAGINLGILTIRYKKPSYLLPVFEHGITPGFIACILKSLGIYSCVSIAFPYIRYIKDKSKLIKHMIIGLIYVLQMEIIAITGVIMTFNVERLNPMSYPKLLQTQLVSYFRFLESGEFFVMLQILGGWFIKYVLTMFAVLLLLKDIKLDNKYSIYIISAFVYAASFFAGKNLFILFKLINYYTYISLINFFIVPLIALSIFSIKNRNSENMQNNIQ